MFIAKGKHAHLLWFSKKKGCDSTDRLQLYFVTEAEAEAEAEAETVPCAAFTVKETAPFVCI